MELTLHTLSRGKNSRQKPKRLGRGNASGHGTYSGKGQKGQRARSGGRKGLRLRGLKTQIQRLPKLGGFKSLKIKPTVVNIQVLNTEFKNGDLITPKVLADKKIIRTVGGRLPKVKILGDGDLTKKIIIKGCQVSDPAKKKIIQAEGSIL